MTFQDLDLFHISTVIIENYYLISVQELYNVTKILKKNQSDL